MISVPTQRAIAKRFRKAHPELTFDQLIELLNALDQGRSHEEKILIGILLGVFSDYRATVQPEHLDGWLDSLHGWEQVDSLCQSTFPAQQLLSDWPVWQSFLQQLITDENINKRRASLVLLTGPVRTSADKRLRDQAFMAIESLKGEKEILITKAVSWLLRLMITNHQELVASYLQQNADTLPRIAVRETRRKLETGMK